MDEDDEGDSPERSFGVPESKAGLYYHISLIGRSHSVDLAAPIGCINNFDSFMNCAYYLSLFCEDEEFRKRVKDKICKYIEEEEAKLGDKE